MSRVPGSARSRLRNVAVAVVAAVALAACGTTVASVPPVVGVPAISISVPLETVACTAKDSCVAVGTLTGSVGPPTIGEYRTAGGRWVRIAVPPTPSAVITTSSCWSTVCLLAGSEPRGDLLWRYDAATHSVAAATAPGPALGVSVVTCYAELSCAMVDTGRTGTPQFLLTADGGSTWTPPTAMGWAGGESVTGLACSTAYTCVASATSSSGPLKFAVTRDRGATWTLNPTPSAWTSLRSLSCWGRRCVALATTATRTRLVRTTSFGRSWTSVSLDYSANALACTTTVTCVVGGQKDALTPWVALVRHGVVIAVALRYVPTPVIDVACGTKVCAAIGVTTLLALAP